MSQTISKSVTGSSRAGIQAAIDDAIDSLHHDALTSTLSFVVTDIRGVRVDGRTTWEVSLDLACVDLDAASADQHPYPNHPYDPTVFLEELAEEEDRALAYYSKQRRPTGSPSNLVAFPGQGINQRVGSRR